MQGADLLALSGLAMVGVFGHHLVLGFNRNDSWRRLMSLFGLPIGIIFTGFELGELFGVVALFLAAMTMIAQGIMYSARGGLGMGSVKEEGITHLDPMKILGVTADITIPYAWKESDWPDALMRIKAAAKAYEESGQKLDLRTCFNIAHTVSSETEINWEQSIFVKH